MPGAELIDLEKLFCVVSKKYKIPRLLIKAICLVESSMDPRAYRYEPMFWKNYMEGKPEWAGRDPKEVSASYGLMQVLYSTAAMFGFNGPGEDLYNPVYNTEIGAAVLRSRINEAEKAGLNIKYGLWSTAIGLARYNGGSYKNPDENGVLRNSAYVKKVMTAWHDLRFVKKEDDSCYDYD